MSTDLAGHIAALTRFPVKGLGPEPLAEVTLRPGEGFPHDRGLGFLRHDIAFDADNPEPMPKTCFHMLARDSALAVLATHYDQASDTLTIDGTRFALGTPEGRADAERAIGDALGLAEDARPHFVRGKDHRFTDASVVSRTYMNAVSLINRATVDDLGARIGVALDPLRFRGNILLEGWPAWSELDLVDRTIAIGPVRLKGLLRIKRCAATTVNPETGINDVFVPRHITEAFGHADLGLYAEVVEGGTIRPDDLITVL